MDREREASDLTPNHPQTNQSLSFFLKQITNFIEQFVVFEGFFAHKNVSEKKNAGKKKNLIHD